MALPSIVSTRIPRKRRDLFSQSGTASPVPAPRVYDSHPSKSTIQSATRTRLVFALLTSLLFLVALVFLILVEIGNISGTKPVLGTIYFIKLDLSNIIPLSTPQAPLINSIARTLGLHDFYQVGLWSYCQGYGNEITECSRPRTLYWFNPVQIILSELLAGATIALPSTVTDALKLVRLASHWMFSLFLTGACCSFVSLFLTPLSIYSRWAAFPIAIFAFFTALTTTAASIIATAMFIIFSNVIKGAEETVNISSIIGREMFAFMWVASACSISGWLIQMGLCCCCASRRDVVKGMKFGRKKAWTQSGEVAPSEVREKDVRNGLLGWKRKR